MKIVFNIIDKIISFINRYIAVIGIVGGVALAFINVVGRYIFNSSFTWASELTIYLFLWSTFFASAYCFKKDAHISISILLEKVNPKVAKILMLFSHIATLMFLLAVAYYGVEYLKFVYELDETSVDLEIPMWIVYLVIPISFFFASYRVAEKIFYILKTPAENLTKVSETKMVLKDIGGDEVLKEVEIKRGGLL